MTLGQNTQADNNVVYISEAPSHGAQGAIPKVEGKLIKVNPGPSASIEVTSHSSESDGEYVVANNESVNFSAQSSSSGLREFKASSGIKNVSGGANFIYPLDRHWSVISRNDYSRLLNDAAGSPLVKDLGSKNQFLLGLGVGYKF